MGSVGLPRARLMPPVRKPSEYRPYSMLSSAKKYCTPSFGNTPSSLPEGREMLVGPVSGVFCV